MKGVQSVKGEGPYKKTTKTLDPIRGVREKKKKQLMADKGDMPIGKKASKTNHVRCALPRGERKKNSRSVLKSQREISGIRNQKGRRPGVPVNRNEMKNRSLGTEGRRSRDGLKKARGLIVGKCHEGGYVHEGELSYRKGDRVTGSSCGCLQTSLEESGRPRPDAP